MNGILDGANDRKRRRGDRGQSFLLARSVAEALQSLDAFPKTIDDLREHTKAGLFISIVVGVAVCALVVAEFVRYIRGDLVHSLQVDDVKGGELDIYIDIEFSMLPCEAIGVDAFDSEGGVNFNLRNDLYKIPVESLARKELSHRRKVHKLSNLREELPPNYCGHCHVGPQTAEKCCNTCEDVKRAFREAGQKPILDSQIEQCVRSGESEPMQAEKEGGCRVVGAIHVHRVSGSFVIAPGHTVSLGGGINLQSLSSVSNKGFNMSFVIYRLRFGAPYDINERARRRRPEERKSFVRGPKLKRTADPKWRVMFPNVLEGTSGGEREAGQHLYALTLVPTSYWRNGRRMDFEQYAATRAFRKSNLMSPSFLLPGLYFKYAMSPMRIDVRTQRESFLHFVVQLCAIIGGVVATFSFVDKTLFNIVRKAPRATQ